MRRVGNWAGRRAIVWQCAKYYLDNGRDQISHDTFTGVQVDSNRIEMLERAGTIRRIEVPRSPETARFSTARLCDKKINTSIAVQLRACC